MFKLIFVTDHPEGSIIEEYLVEECMTFVIKYLNGVATALN